MRITILIVIAGVAYGQALTVSPAANPAAAGAIQANLSATHDGKAILSWVEPSEDGFYTLRYAIRRGEAWSQPQTVAAHRHIFRHPAELPEVIALSNGTMLAHWVEQPESGGDAEFVYVSGSRHSLPGGGGEHWSTPVMANRDRSQVEHGLASMTESGKGEASLTWLQALHGEDGPVTLMRSVIGEDGKAIKEEILDTDVCACCPTSIVKTSRGLLVAYRDHTPSDIRDIATIRFESGRWSAPKIIHADNWKLNACPVNAAAAAAAGDRAAVAWYTGADGSPKVQVAFSADAGSTFGRATQVSTGPSSGYASIALSGGGAIVSWLEQGGGVTHLMARRVSAAGVAGPVKQIAQGSRAALGYPRLVQAGAETWMAWGGGSEEAPKIMTARLK